MNHRCIKAIASALFAVGCNTVFAQGPLLTVVGSNTIGAELGPACAQGYLKDVLGADSAIVVPSGTENEFTVIGDNRKEIVFKAHGSSTGFKAIKAGEADVAMASRPIKDTEAAALSHLGDFNSAAAEHTIAIDGLAVIVHPNNPVKALTVDQVKSIFTGQVNNWRQLGGFDATITVLARDAQSGTFDTFNSMVLKKTPLAANARRFESNNVLSSEVSNNPTAIGFTSIAAVGNNTVLAVAEGETQFLRPNQLTVASEDYLLSRRLFMYTPTEKQNPQAKNFVDYCLSSQGQELVAETGFVPQKIITVAFEANDSFPPEYNTLANDSNRLSVNFRFAPSSAELDTKAVRDLDRLKAFYESNQKPSITLVGFSDAARSASTAKILSKMRAMAVKDALRERGITVENILALGDSMMVAGSQTNGAKAKNGRVEVWIN